MVRNLGELRAAVEGLRASAALAARECREAGKESEALGLEHESLAYWVVLCLIDNQD